MSNIVNYKLIVFYHILIENMEANISNYYVSNENNQISISKTSIVSRGRVKILGTKNDD